MFFPVFAFAQINESDTLRVKAGLSLSGFWQSGNIQTLTFRANSDFSFKPWKKAVFKNQNSYVFQEFGDDGKDDEDFLSLNFLYFNPERKVYPLLLGFVSTNFRRKIDVRYLVGGGVSYQFHRKNKDWIKASLTTEYERTNFNETRFNYTEYNGINSINTFRATLWLNGKYHFFKDKVILSHESYVQPSLEKKNNYRWRADITAEFPIWKFLSFRINYLHTSESIVVFDQEQEDQFLTFGFSIKNY